MTDSIVVCCPHTSFSRAGGEGRGRGSPLLSHPEAVLHALTLLDLSTHEFAAYFHKWTQMNVRYNVSITTSFIFCVMFALILCFFMQ